MNRVHDEGRINTIKKYNEMSDDDLILELTYYTPNQNDFGIIQSIIQTRLNKKLIQNINVLEKSINNLKKVIEKNNRETVKYNKRMKEYNNKMLVLTFLLVIITVFLLATADWVWAVAFLVFSSGFLTGLAMPTRIIKNIIKYTKTKIFRKFKNERKK